MNGTIFIADAVAAQAQSDLTTAYNILAARPATADLTGLDLGGQVLTPGVYNFDTSAQLTGILTLDAQGDPGAVFVFNIGSTLTTAAASSVVLINGADANNVFFRVGSSATLGATTAFQGRILALTDITLITGATINCGAALARNGAVTLDSNVITVCPMTATTIGGVLDDVVDGGGILPIGFLVLATLTPEELADALAQLAGEAGTGFGPTASGAMDSFLSVVMNHRDGRGVTRGEEPAQDTISVMGYAADISSHAAFSGFDQLAPEPTSWDVWAAVYGGYGVTRGDAASETHDRTSLHYGLAAGADYDVNDSTMVGLAFGVGQTRFGLSDDLGGGHSAMFNAAVHGRTDFDPAYLSGALAYGLHLAETDRYVTIAGIDHFNAKFTAHNVAGHIEAGYQVGLFTPYVAARGQVLYTPSYDETTVSGLPTFALSYAERWALTGRTEVGLKYDWTTPIADDATLALHAQAAWLHAFGSNTDMQAAFQLIPDAPFTVSGAAAPADSLLLSLSGDVDIGNNLTLGGMVESELSVARQTIGGNLTISRRW